MKKYIIFCIILFISILILSIVLYYRKKQQYEEFKRHEPILNSLKTDIEKLVPYLTHDEIIKLSQLRLQPDIKSYTINKKDMHLCLEDADGKYYEKNMLIYATLHELAHIFCDEIGHTLKYHKIFARLLDIAENIHIYDPKSILPQKYCGIDTR